jgi:hypothetical protein
MMVLSVYKAAQAAPALRAVTACAFFRARFLIPEPAPRGLLLLKPVVAMAQIGLAA